ncbi:MAG: hypothetical protein QW607_04970 [Desulfurococcaceae archaeon]
MYPIENYLSRYKTHYDLYIKTHKFLPSLKEKKIFVKINEHISQISVSRDLEKEDTWYIEFNEDPPEPSTLIQAFIYIETGDKGLAEDLTHILLYAIVKDLPSFNLIDLLNINLETINTVLYRCCKIKSFEDYLTLKGKVHRSICYLDHDTMTIKLKENAPIDEIARILLKEINDSIAFWYNPSRNECISIECLIFEELASILSKHNTSNKQ